MGAIQSVGSLLPALTGTLGTVQAIASTVNAVQNFANPGEGDDLALQQLQARQSLEEQQLAAQTALDRQQLSTATSAAEEDRLSALRRAVARQRAQFGSSGISASGGSSEAVLLGLIEESDQDRSQREQVDVLRNASLDLDTSQVQSLNLLQATQLAEKQSLNDLF